MFKAANVVASQKEGDWDINVPSIELISPTQYANQQNTWG